MKEPIWITKKTVLAIQSRLLAQFGGLPGLRDEGLLESALDRPRNLLAYGEPDLFKLAAAYAMGIVEEARALCHEYIAAARADDNIVFLTSSLTYMGEIMRTEGDLQGALGIYAELIPLAHQRGNTGNLVITYGNHSLILDSLNQQPAAAEALRKAVQAAVGTSSKRILVAVVDLSNGLLGASCRNGPLSPARMKTIRSV